MDKTSLPIILLRGIVILPYAELKIDLVDDLDTKIIDLANSEHNGLVLLVSPDDYLEEKVEIKKLPKLGIVGKVSKKTILPNGCVRITIEGLRRAKIDNYFQSDNNNEIFLGKVSSPTRYAIDINDEVALVKKLKNELENYINKVEIDITDIMKDINSQTIEYLITIEYENINKIKDYQSS